MVVLDSVLIQIDNLGVPRVGILYTFAGEYRDSVRFDYRVLDEEGDPDTFGIVYFGVIPYDRDEGRFDSTSTQTNLNISYTLQQYHPQL